MIFLYVFNWTKISLTLILKELKITSRLMSVIKPSRTYRSTSHWNLRIQTCIDGRDICCLIQVRTKTRYKLILIPKKLNLTPNYYSCAQSVIFVTWISPILMKTSIESLGSLKARVWELIEVCFRHFINAWKGISKTPLDNSKNNSQRNPGRYF